MRIYPKGEIGVDNGKVSVFLFNDSKKPIFVKYRLKIGDTREKEGMTLALPRLLQLPEMVH